MPGFKRERLFHTILCLILIGCIFAYLAVFAVMNFWGFEDYCNSDVYADTQIARRMWEQKTLFPVGWRFGNQYYVVATPVLAALFYGITNNINVSMILATELMTVLILVSFVWLLRAFTKDTLLQLTACLLLIASAIAPYGPYSVNSMLFYMQASFYACYLITLFVVFGDYIRMFSGKNRGGELSWIVAMLLCFATGMQSLRQTVVTILPIAACEVFFIIRRMCSREKLCDSAVINRWARVATYALGNMFGIFLIGRLNVNSASIYGEMRLIPPSQWLERMLPIKDAFFEITSLDYILMGDYSRALAAVILFMVMLVAAAAVIWLLHIRSQETGENICWLLSVVGIIGVFLSTVVLNITLRAIYVFMWFPLVAFSGIMVLQKLLGAARKGMILLICVFSITGLLYCYVPSVQALAAEGESVKYQLAQWAVENGYEYVYGEYWGDTPGIGAYSNGKIEAGCWHSPENVFQVEMSNTPQDIYGVEENEKAIYVFRAEEKEIALQKAQQQGVELTQVAEFDGIFVYVSSAPLMYTI